MAPRKNAVSTVGSGDDMTKPKSKLSAYTYFLKTFKEAHSASNIPFSEFSKRASEQWKQMSDKQKQPFVAKSNEDKKRFEEEMVQYMQVTSTSGGGAPGSIATRGGRGSQAKEGKAPKDPNAPKRPLSSFLWFTFDERPKVKLDMPNISNTDVTREMGRRWGMLVDRSKYEQEAIKDKARYEAEMARYKSGSGSGTVARGGGGSKPVAIKKAVPIKAAPVATAAPPKAKKTVAQPPPPPPKIQESSSSEEEEQEEDDEEEMEEEEEEDIDEEAMDEDDVSYEEEQKQQQADDSVRKSTGSEEADDEEELESEEEEDEEEEEE